MEIFWSSLFLGIVFLALLLKTLGSWLTLIGLQTINISSQNIMASKLNSELLSQHQSAQKVGIKEVYKMMIYCSMSMAIILLTVWWVLTSGSMQILMEGHARHNNNLRHTVRIYLMKKENSTQWDKSNMIKIVIITWIEMDSWNGRIWWKNRY